MLAQIEVFNQSNFHFSNFSNISFFDSHARDVSSTVIQEGLGKKVRTRMLVGSYQRLGNDRQLPVIEIDQCMRNTEENKA